MYGHTSHEPSENDDPENDDPENDARSTERAGVRRMASDTDRAVSPVIGAILMFALALALLAVLQMTAIPALNEGLEFQHNERVQTDVRGIAGTIDRVAATGSEETVSIEAGLRYPPRLFFVNPPPVSGTVRTTEPDTLEIANAAAAGETGDYWNGTPRTFETRSLEYAPDYNEYGSAPVTVSEPWVVYDRFDGTNRAETEQNLVDGRRIDFVALEGERSVSRAGDVSIGVEPTSAPARTVTVRDDGEPVTLTVPTRLTENEWADLLADELDSAGEPDDGRYVRSIDCQRAPPDPCGKLTLALEQGATYELRLGAVALGSGVSEEKAAYLTDVDGNATAIPEGGRQRLVVEARDRFDNPVSGVTVTGSADGDGTVRAVQSVTDVEGRATFVYDAPDDINRTRDVEPTLRFGEGSSREVAFDIRVTDRDGGSNSDGGGSTDGGESSDTEPSVTITDIAPNTGGNDRYDVTLDATDPDGNLRRVRFELRDPDEPETAAAIDAIQVTLNDDDGDAVTATRELRARGSERLASYRIVVTATDADGTVASAERTVSGG
ncbi:Ig-like domain-containing protein [Natrinema sp. DC36]|uniref:Ig-like domain-containing protein n=1 Tax=Natrinema sp. DC36 TaxID=2878680 RepID=UPI001CF06C1E|nr:Ig-like domain-containing protein [Natrinema sp. DC36]